MNFFAIVHDFRLAAAHGFVLSDEQLLRALFTSKNADNEHGADEPSGHNDTGVSDLGQLSIQTMDDNELLGAEPVMNQEPPSGSTGTNGNLTSEVIGNNRPITQLSAPQSTSNVQQTSDAGQTQNRHTTISEPPLIGQNSTGSDVDTIVIGSTSAENTHESNVSSM